MVVMGGGVVREMETRRRSRRKRRIRRGVYMDVHGIDD